MDKFDPRIVELHIETGGQLRKYKDLYIKASGVKFSNDKQADCTVEIANLRKDVANQILTDTTPFSKSKRPAKFYLYAGRVSTGLQLLYAGDVTESSITQPPDRILTLKAKTNNANNRNPVTRSHGAQAPLKEVATGVGKDLGLNVVFEASDMNVGNYSFTGAASRQVSKLNEIPGVQAFVDNDQLIVQNRKEPLKNRTALLNTSSGMIGIPTADEKGIKVTYMLDTVSSLGGALVIDSKVNPGINGTFKIIKLSFEVSNFDTPFYWNAECTRL